MQTRPQLSSHRRVRSPETRHHEPHHEPPLKRRRRTRWCDIVDSRALANGIERDPHRVAQRQKQIDYGKNTIAYDRFIALCPRHTRVRGDPMTPLPRQKCSKRSFGGQITSWKKQVYAYVANLDQNENPKPASLAPPAEQPRLQNQQSIEQGKDIHNDETENFSDLDDIQLDDFGNLVSNTPPQSPKHHRNGQAKNAHVSPASIFDAF